MRMDHFLNVSPSAIGQPVHAEFAGYVAAAGALLALHVDDHHICRPHPAFTDAGGSHQNAVALQSDGQIAVHGSHEPVIVEHAPVSNDFFPVFAFRWHGYPCMVTLW